MATGWMAMERELFVYVDMAGQAVLAGRLWTRARAQAHRRAESATFLYDTGWLERPDRFSLEPAYDLNPVPTDVAPRILATAIHFDDATASLELALEVAPYFELDASSAQATIAEIARATARWRRTAESYGLASAEASRMASAFEHADLELAQRLQVDGM